MISVKVPNKPGVWKLDDQLIDVYFLDPTGDLCFWGPDIGISYNGLGESQSIWITDEWCGHIPVTRFNTNGSQWQFISEFQES